MIPKFRAWLREDKSMNNVECMNFDFEHVFLSGWRESFNIKDIELMQSTGLKDKNGVEIYEGDVVVGQQHLTTDLSTPFEIKGLVRYSKRNTMFYLDGEGFGHDKFMHSLGSSIYQYEVIGNRFENQELLEET